MEEEKLKTEEDNILEHSFQRPIFQYQAFHCTQTRWPSKEAFVHCNRNSSIGLNFYESILVFSCNFVADPSLRRGSAATIVLGLQVRIPQWAWMSVSVGVVCCHVEVSASG